MFFVEAVPVPPRMPSHHGRAGRDTPPRANEYHAGTQVCATPQDLQRRPLFPITAINLAPERGASRTAMGKHRANLPPSRPLGRQKGSDETTTVHAW